MLSAESYRRKCHDRVTPAIRFLFIGERVLACAVHIVEVSRPNNVRIAVASQVLLQASCCFCYG